RSQALSGATENPRATRRESGSRLEVFRKVAGEILKAAGPAAPARLGGAARFELLERRLSRVPGADAAKNFGGAAAAAPDRSAARGASPALPIRLRSPGGRKTQTRGGLFVRPANNVRDGPADR